MLIGNSSVRIGFFLTLLPPQEVIKGALTIGDAPMHHHALGIALLCFPKAFHSFFEIESKTPIQSKIEPALGFNRGGGNFPCMRSKIKAVHSRVSDAQ